MHQREDHYACKKYTADKTNIAFNYKLHSDKLELTIKWWLRQQNDPGPIQYQYRKISWSLEAVRLTVSIISSLWNVSGISAALLPRRLSRPLRKKRQWNLMRNAYIFIQESAFEMSFAKWRSFCFGLNVSFFKATQISLHWAFAMCYAILNRVPWSWRMSGSPASRCIFIAFIYNGFQSFRSRGNDGTIVTRWVGESQHGTCNRTRYNLNL